MRKYNKNNCDNKVRDCGFDKLGRPVILTGRHAFEWQIVIQCNSYTMVTTFKCRKDAKKAFKEYKSKR